MKKFYPFLAIVFFTCHLFSQPTRLWGTYYGDTGNEVIRYSTVNASGDVLVCGYSTSNSNIATIGSQQPLKGGMEDAFIAKFNSAGVRQWGTYFGGPDNERANSIYVDASGNIYIAGTTSSSVSIATPGCHQAVYGNSTDAFLAKYNSAGVLQWATYYGGSDFETGWTVTADASGNVYLVGSTGSANNISTAGSHQVVFGGLLSDGFIVKFNSAGVRQWATYYGDTQNDYGLSVAVDAGNNIYMSGYSYSTNSISTPGSHQPNLDGGLQSDAYLVKFNSAGIRQWATYYGGSYNESGKTVAVDQSGNVYLAGFSGSTNNISTPGCHQFSFAGIYDGFLAKFNTSGVRQWGTYYGGSGNDGIHYIGIDGSNTIFISGDVQSGNDISTPGSHQPNYAGNMDGFMSKFNSSGVRQWGTYYGGTGTDRCFSMCIDQAGNMYMGGEASSYNAISTPGCHQFTFGGLTDGCLVKFADCMGIPDLTINGPTVVCGGAAVYSVAPGGISYTWSLPGGWSGSSTTNTISATPGSSGIFSLTATSGCGTSPQQTLYVTVSSSPTISVNSGSICLGNSFTMVPSGASTYTFEGGSPVVSPTVNTSFTVIGTNSLGCVSQSFAISNITVNALPLPTITVNSGAICTGQSFTIIPSGANTYTFSGGSAIVSPTASTSYSVSGTSSLGCISPSTAVSNITVNSLPNVSVTSTSSLLCVGQTATLNALGASSYTWSTGSNVAGIIISPTITTTYTVSGTNSVTGCSNSYAFTQNVSPCTGITELSLANDLFIYPNPNNGSFKIQVESEIINGGLVLLNELGQIIHEQNLVKGENVIATKNIAQGLYYYIILQNHTQISNGKILIEPNR